jgi:outer membrane protein assembly factor BamD
MRVRIAFPSLFLLCCLLLTGCSGSTKLRHNSPQEAYGKGVVQYEKKRYADAVPFFQGVFDYGRTHQWAADAQLFLARSYRGNEEYLLAANEYTRFIDTYRNDPRVPEAEFERAMTYYERSPGFELDQTDTGQGITYLQLFLNRYPGHALASEAETRLAELRDKLARKEYETGRLYERRELFSAAALSYETAFDRYPGSPWADEALVGAVRCYVAYAAQSVPSKQAERYQQAIDNYERLLQLFPESPVLKEAEGFYEQARSALQRLAGRSS